MTQSEFDRQAEITRLLLEGISSTHVSTRLNTNLPIQISFHAYSVSTNHVTYSIVLSIQAHHLRCLHDFVEAQMTYYAQCYQYMVDLQKQLGKYAIWISLFLLFRI